MLSDMVIDQQLVEEARKGFGVETQREAVELALRQAVQLQRQEGLLSLRGIGWEGDLDAMRTDG
ncbi:type II toxin-antitoxin system VapB family antitoxin [Sphingomonas qilianensis]|uniref:Type II toxin-antitoxin system VapB family antitoxin n=1 Tax=Sphingomonas qilianensis TaxID=1736690 RepID=A0ABU9XNB9_9SPHN